MKVRHRWSNWGWYYKHDKWGISLHYGRFCLSNHYGLPCVEWQDGVPPKKVEPIPASKVSSRHESIWKKFIRWGVGK